MITHGTFTIERHYDATPERVYQAFADPKMKATWFRGPSEWREPKQSHDFRIGGHETSEGGPKDGFTTKFDCTYQDIVQNERIVYTYVMHIDGKFLSASVATLLFEKQGNGCKLTLTEAGAYAPIFPGDQNKSRKNGTEDLLAALGKFLSGA